MHYFWVLKKFGSEWGSINIFCRNFFVSQCRKFLYGNPLPLHCFPVAKKFGYEWGEEYQDFPSKKLCLTVPKISVKESFTVALLLDIEKICIRVGEYQYFLSKFFRLTVPKIFVRESVTVALFSGSEKVWI